MYDFKEDFDLAKNDPISFWDKVAKTVYWDKMYEMVYSEEDEIYPNWFKGGLLNTCYNVLDIHINNPLKKDKLAIIYECSFLNKTIELTYNQLYEKVTQFSRVLLNMGINKDDIVMIYMSNSIESIITMLSCARIGACYCILFDSYTVNGIVDRLNVICPKLIILSNYSISNNEIIPLTPILIESLELSNFKPEFIITLNRNEINLSKHIKETISNIPKILNSFDWYQQFDECSLNPFYDYIPVESSHPLYIIYTSGTSGNPKGIVRGNGSHMVSQKYTGFFKGAITDPCYFSASLFAWASFQNYFYSFLSIGGLNVVFEGGCLNKNDQIDNFWKITEKHKVNYFLSNPTLFNMIKCNDPEAKSIKKYDLSSLKNIILSGEPTDNSLKEYIENKINISLLNFYGSTETGFVGFSSIGLHPSFCKPFIPSLNVSILSEDSSECKINEIGEIVFKLPLPPGFALSLYKDNVKFIKTYFSKYKGYFATSDLGSKDENGNFKIIARIDNFIIIDYNKIEIRSIELSILNHPLVIDCYCVGIKDDSYGQIPIGLIVLKDNIKFEHSNLDQLKNELNHLILKDNIKLAQLKSMLIVKSLPKTITGKCNRSIFFNLFNDDSYEIPKSINNYDLINEINQQWNKSNKISNKKNFNFI